MAEVIVNVKANTGQATNQVDDLNDSLDQTSQAADKASDSLELQEKRIKTLGGAINIVGGSVELLAGSLALSGALTEEQVEKFESAAVGAIAFADGAKRIFEGYKELTEATKLATSAQVANNAAVLANPYVAAAAAVAALAAGLFFLYKRTQVVITAENRREGALNAARKAAEAATVAQNEYNRALDEEFNAADNSIRVLKARGASVKEIFQAEKALALLRIESAKALIKEEERQNEELRKVVEANERVEEATGGVVNGNKELKEAYEANKQELSDARKSLNDLETELKILTIDYRNTTSSTDANSEALERNAQAAQAAADEQVELSDRLDNIYEEQLSNQQRELNAVQDKYFQLFEYYKDDAEVLAFLTEAKRKDEQAINDKYDKIIADASVSNDEERKALDIQRTNEYYDKLIAQAEEFGYDTEQLEKARQAKLTEIEKSGLDERTKLQKAFESDTVAAAEATLSTTIGLLATIRETTDDGTKKGFEQSKKFRIAETRLSSIQAAFDAYKSLAGVPYVGQILGVAAAAAALAAGQKAIADIQASTYNDTSAPSSPFSSATASTSTATFGVGTSTIGGAIGTVLPSTATTGEPIRAYVVSSEIASAAEEESAIRKRRTL